MNRSVVPDVDYAALSAAITTAGEDVYAAIVNAPFDNKLAMAWLFLGFICLYVVDEEKQQVAFAAASNTDQYRMALERYNIDMANYRLDLAQDADNTIVRAITSQTMQDTSDWATMGRKVARPEVVRLNQANSGIAYSAIYPFSADTRGALMYNFYQHHENLGDAPKLFMEQYTKLVGDHFAATALAAIRR